PPIAGISRRAGALWASPGRRGGDNRQAPPADSVDPPTSAAGRDRSRPRRDVHISLETPPAHAGAPPAARRPRTPQPAARVVRRPAVLPPLRRTGRGKPAPT